MTRTDLERRYVVAATALQLWWRNAINHSDFDNIGELTDEQLAVGLRDSITQLRFEKWFLKPLEVIVAISIPLALLYGLVRFVKWAWVN